MRQPTRGFTAVTLLAAAGLLGTAVFCPAANAQRERSLLGVHIWDSTWRSVLAKYGQPTRISVGASAAAAQSVAGAPGMPGMTGMPGMPASAGMTGGRLPGLSGMGPGGGGPMGGYAAMMQRRGGRMGGPMAGGPMGMGSLMGGGSQGDLPGGFGGASGPGVPGMPAGLGAPPSMGGTAEGQEQVAPEDEVTWVYERGPRTDFFLFNRDGRLIQVQSFGYANGAVTSRGVRLGDNSAKIYHDYGWPDNLEKDAGRGTMLLDYSKKHNVAFQLLDRHDGRGYRVVGITVGLTDKSQIPGNGGK